MQQELAELKSLNLSMQVVLSELQGRSNLGYTKRKPRLTARDATLCDGMQTARCPSLSIR